MMYMQASTIVGTPMSLEQIVARLSDGGYCSEMLAIEGQKSAFLCVTAPDSLYAGCIVRVVSTDDPNVRLIGVIEPQGEQQSIAGDVSDWLGIATVVGVARL